MPDGSGMDFEEAVSIHSKWKRELRRSVAKHDSCLHPANMSVDHKCALGQWIYSEGVNHYSLPEYTKLKAEHARFHVIAADLLRKANSGESIEADLEPCSSSEFSMSSSAIVIALMALKKRLLG